MSIQDLTWGMTDAIASRMADEKKQARAEEDAELEYRKSMIQALISRPDFNPAHIGQAMHDLMDISNAKANTSRKRKAGPGGVFGQTELPPIGSILQMLQDGKVFGNGDDVIPQPPQGVPMPPMGQVPATTPQNEGGHGVGLGSMYAGQQTQPEAQRGAGLGSMYASRPPALSLDEQNMPSAMDIPGGATEPQGYAPTGGQSILEQPVSVPPKGTPMSGTGQGMLDAAQQMTGLPGQQPQAPLQLPMPKNSNPTGVLKTPQQMAQEAGMMESERYLARERAEQQALIDSLRAAGASEDEIRKYLLERVKGRVGGAMSFTAVQYMTPAGQRIPAQLNRATGEVRDMYGNVLNLPPGSVQVGIGSPYQVNPFQDDNGNVTAGVTNRQMPGGGMTEIPVAPGLQGRTSPDGPAVQYTTPEGQAGVGRFERQGTQVQPGSVAPSTPGGPAAPLMPPPTADLRAQAQALQALPTIIKGVKDVITPINKGNEQGAVTGFINRSLGIGAGLAGKVGANDKAERYTRMRNSFTASLSRFAGEKGVLTDADVARATDMLPKLGDSDVLTAQAMDQLEAFLKAKMSTLPTPVNYGGGQQQPGQSQQPAAAGQYQVGQTIRYQGQLYKVTGVNPVTGKQTIAPVQ